MTIRLPLTLAIIDGFAVGIGEETYILPVDAVLECFELPADARTEGSCLVSLRGQALPCARLREIFRVDAAPARRENVVVVRHDEGRAGLIVDTLHGQHETVVRPLDRMFQGIPGLSGSTILGGGRVAFILDVPRVVETQNVVAEPVQSGG